VEGLMVQLRAARQNALDRSLASITEEAEKLAATHDFQAAAKLCTSYDGADAHDLRARLTGLAERYERMAAEKALACDALRTVLARCVVDADLAGCAAELAGSEYREAFADLAEAVVIARTAEATIVASFKSQEGKIVPVQVGGNAHTVRIAAVDGDRITTEKRVGNSMGKRILTVDDLDVGEQAKRLGETDPVAKAIYLGGIAVRAGDFRAARSHFAEAGGLSDALLARLETVRLAEELAADAEVPSPPPATAIATPDRPAPTAAEKADINPRHIDLRAIIHRRTRNAAFSDYDDKRQSVGARVTLRNGTDQDLEDLQTELYVIGRSVTDDDVYRLLKRIEKKISVKRGRRGSTAETEMSILYDDHLYAQFGYKYYGYIVLLKDSKGALLTAKLSRSKFRDLEPKIGTLKENMCFDLEGDRVRGRENRFGL